MNRQRCHACRDEIVSRRRGEWTVRAKILKLNDGGEVVAKCSRCGSETPLHALSWTDPSPESEGMEKADPTPRRRRVAVRRSLDRPDGT